VRALPTDRGTGLGQCDEAKHHRAFAVAHLPHQFHALQLAARALAPAGGGVAVEQRAEQVFHVDLPRLLVFQRLHLSSTGPKNEKAVVNDGDAMTTNCLFEAFEEK